MCIISLNKPSVLSMHCVVYLLNKAELAELVHVLGHKAL